MLSGHRLNAFLIWGKRQIWQFSLLTQGKKRQADQKEIKLP